MSRYVLRASCKTPDPFVDIMSMGNAATQIDPKKLTVIVGDRVPQHSDISITQCSGGLCAEQLFEWENFDTLTKLDPTRLFFDPDGATVTLSVDLEASSSTTNQNDLIPPNTFAVNLGSKGWQFNASNMLNEDVWGKLVYYEPGGLGIGWSFSANRYLNRQGMTVGGGLGMYMLGGLLPDVDYQTLSANTNYDYTSAYPIYNAQISRDQSLLSHMTSINNINGIQGYWSVSPRNVNTTTASLGRFSGGIINYNSAIPGASTLKNFGSVGISYPTALQTSAQTTPIGWNLLFPSYAPSTTDGYMPSGNCLSITPGAFFTTDGLTLLQQQASNPTNPVVTGKYWTDYWKSASSTIHLEETQPFRVESPLFEAPINIQYIPNITSGLSLLVPVTRICNGVYFYLPISLDTSTASTTAVYPLPTARLSFPGASYNEPLIGRLQRWFEVKSVKLTLNLPFMYIGSPTQAARFFNTPTYETSLGMNVPVWIKYYFAPEFGEDGQVLSRISAHTTASFQQIGSEMQGGYMQFTYTARQLLNRMNSVFSAHNIQISGGWGLSEVQIRRVLVSCTTTVDLVRLYGVLFGLPSFVSSLQGNVLTQGGIKVFSRCGPFMSNGAPNNAWIEFDDVVGSEVGINFNGVRSAHFDLSNSTNNNRGNSNNDYFISTSSFSFTNTVNLRMPNIGDDSDSGGSMTIAFAPRPTMNIPFSGEVLNNPQTGGVQLPTSITTPSTPDFAGYNQGWFNNLNPFSPDHNITYNYANVTSPDNLPFLDYKMVDLTQRKIEIWIQILVPLQIYANDPFSTSVDQPGLFATQKLNNRNASFAVGPNIAQPIWAANGSSARRF